MSPRNLKLAGYEMKPQAQFQQELTAYIGLLAQGATTAPPPKAATPVYADEQGDHYLAVPSEEGVIAIPFIPGSPAQGDSGGFMPADKMPKGETDNG
jgi:hypothetical protein